MLQPPRSFRSSNLQSHILVAGAGLTSVILFWQPLYQLAALSLGDPRYSHIILVPVISAFIVYLERKKIFARTGVGFGLSLLFLISAVVMYILIALGVVPVPVNYLLSIATLAIVLCWASSFAVCYGEHAFTAAIFPILFLLLLVPIPFDLMDKIVSGLQWGSAEVSFALFKVAGVPVFKDGVNFELPGVGIEIAKECSSIHSGWALFITGLMVAHMFLRSFWSKFCLSLFTVPIAMFTNSVRIVTIWFLGTKVNVGFFYGNLHRNGGILFSLISLSLLLGVLCLLRKLERPARRTISANDDRIKVSGPASTHAASIP